MSPKSYDFTISASLFGFFPAYDPLTGLLLAVSTLGIGVVARPPGGPLFGAYSDRYGCKSAMTLTIWLRAFAAA